MNPVAISAQQMLDGTLVQPIALIRIADSPDLLAEVGEGREHVQACLDVICHDVTEDMPGMRAPRLEDAERIWGFAREHRELQLVVQCQNGAGRSRGVVAALVRAHGMADAGWRASGTYNRRLYELVLDVAGVERDPDPLVSMAVRVKYPADRLLAFMLAMERQTYPNWEVIATVESSERLVTTDWQSVLQRWGEDRLALIMADGARERWGHLHRQKALDACKGQYVGMSNDDNYYVPGYLSQLVLALETAESDLAVCPMLHSYAGWQQVDHGADLGCWLARRSLVEQVKWPDAEFDADRRFLAAMQEKTDKVTLMSRPLFVHN